MDRLNYVYIVFRSNGIPLYVGKGSGKRWAQHGERARHNKHYARVLAKNGGDLPTAVIAHGLTESQAFALEELLTRAIGIEGEGGPLVNRGHGGRGGPIGVKHSKKWRENRRRKAIEAWKDETFRAKQLHPDRNRSGNFHPRTEAFKTVVAEKMRGNTHTLGLRHSDAAKTKMRSRWQDPVWRATEMARRRASGMYSPKSCSARWEKRKANRSGKF